MSFCGEARQAAAHPATDDDARRYRTLIEQLPLVVYVDALDAESSNIFTSRQVEPLLGYTTAEWASDMGLFVRALHAEDRDRVLAAHAHTHRTHQPLSVEYRVLAKDGRVVWVRDEGVIVLDDDGAPLYLQGYLLDITAERDAQDQLRKLALYDTLTGLANRAFFHEQFQHAVSIRKERDQQTALLFLDVNDFKHVNDQWGHPVGDRVLATLGARIQHTLRAGDAAARLGGDEFAVVVPAIGEASEAVRVAERLLDAIRTPIELAGRRVLVSASIGISVGHDVAAMLQEADAAMYRAKAQRDGGYAFFEPELDTFAAERSRRVNELREAVDVGQFTLEYQPVIDLGAHAIMGYEALLRWQHPVDGKVAPLDFIPLAEESGLIIPLGKWVLEEACRYGAQLCQEMGRELNMSVNVSARSARASGLRRARRGSTRRVRLRTALPDPRADRERPARLGRAHAAASGRAEDERDHARARRLRHRLRVALVPAALPGRHREDRPQLHRDDRIDDRRPRVAARDRRPRKRARPAAGRRGHPDARPARDRPRARLPQRAGLLLRPSGAGCAAHAGRPPARRGIGSAE